MQRSFTLLLISMFLIGCSKWKTNEEYIDYLASIVLSYQAKHGKLPGNFSDAHADSGIILPNRGDIDGNSLAYYQFAPDSFMFRSYGKNGKDELGNGNDIDIYYVEGKKVNRSVFLDHVKTHTDPITWEIYRVIFRNENGA